MLSWPIPKKTTAYYGNQRHHIANSNSFSFADNFWRRSEFENEMVSGTLNCCKYHIVSGDSLFLSTFDQKYEDIDNAKNAPTTKRKKEAFIVDVKVLIETHKSFRTHHRNNCKKHRPV